MKISEMGENFSKAFKQLTGMDATTDKITDTDDVSALRTQLEELKEEYTGNDTSELLKNRATPVQFPKEVSDNISAVNSKKQGKGNPPPRMNSNTFAGFNSSGDVPSPTNPYVNVQAPYGVAPASPGFGETFSDSDTSEQENTLNQVGVTPREGTPRGAARLQRAAPKKEDTGSIPPTLQSAFKTGLSEFQNADTSDFEDIRVRYPKNTDIPAPNKSIQTQKVPMPSSNDYEEEYEENFDEYTPPQQSSFKSSFSKSTTPTSKRTSTSEHLNSSSSAYRKNHTAWNDYDRSLNEDVDYNNNFISSFRNPSSGNKNADKRMSEETTTIARYTVVEGTIHSLGNLDIKGDIKGDIETTKNIDLNGKVVGDITCFNAAMGIAQVQGNMSLKGSLDMGADTVLVGNLAANEVALNGKVKGNVSTSSHLRVNADSVLFGDITASTITVEEGAIIQGYVMTTFLSKEEANGIFPDNIMIGNQE